MSQAETTLDALIEDLKHIVTSINESHSLHDVKVKIRDIYNGRYSAAETLRGHIQAMEQREAEALAETSDLHDEVIRLQGDLADMESELNRVYDIANRY